MFQIYVKRLWNTLIIKIARLKQIPPLQLSIIIAVTGLALIGLGLYPINIYLPNTSYWEVTTYISPLETKKVELGMLPLNSLVIVKVFVYSVSPTLTMSLMNSFGETVFPKVSLDNQYSFIFRSPKDDFYYFVFENSPSEYSKEILWKVYYYGNYDLVFLILGTGLFISSMLVIILNLMGYDIRNLVLGKRKTKKEKI